MLPETVDRLKQLPSPDIDDEDELFAQVEEVLAVRQDILDGNEQQGQGSPTDEVGRVRGRLALQQQGLRLAGRARARAREEAAPPQGAAQPAHQEGRVRL